MYKEFMLHCSVYNVEIEIWEDQTYYFDSLEEMTKFIKEGNSRTKSEHIRISAAFKLERLNNIL